MKNGYESTITSKTNDVLNKRNKNSPELKKQAENVF